MNNLITALILSPTLTDVKTYEGINNVIHVSKFDTLQELHKQRLASIKKVTTPYFIYMDSDDSFTNNYLNVIDKIIVKMKKDNYSIGYGNYRTNNYSILKNITDAPIIEDTVFGELDNKKFYNDFLYLHKSVILRTKDALQLIQKIPEGLYFTEYMLYAALSRIGASYVDEILYIWNKHKTGMHTKKDNVNAQFNSMMWYMNKYSILK